MIRNMILGTAILLSAGLGRGQAVPPTTGTNNPNRPMTPGATPTRPMPPPVTQPNRPVGGVFAQLARDWVRLYLRRNATDREVLLIVNQLRGGMSRDAIQANILASPEYFSDNRNNVIIWGRSVVSDTLGRPITPYEQSLIQQIVWAQGRFAAALTVLESRNIVPPWWYGGW